MRISVTQLRVTLTLWLLKAMTWTTTERLLSEYFRVFLWLFVCVCMCVNSVSLFRSKLTNDDFRKLLMTPRAAPSSAPPSKSRHHEWVTEDIITCCRDMIIMTMMMMGDWAKFFSPECHGITMKMRIQQQGGGRRKGKCAYCMIFLLDLKDQKCSSQQILHFCLRERSVLFVRSRCSSLNCWIFYFS